jgi:NitT/TauT family transport system substrate-binding protein
VQKTEDIMPTLFRRLAATLAALLLSSGLALAQSKITIAVGGGSCLCYLPTMLAQSLGEYEKAGVKVEIIDFKGGSESRQRRCRLRLFRPLRQSRGQRPAPAVLRSL